MPGRKVIVFTLCIMGAVSLYAQETFSFTCDLLRYRGRDRTADVLGVSSTVIPDGNFLLVLFKTNARPLFFFFSDVESTGEGFMYETVKQLDPEIYDEMDREDAGERFTEITADDGKEKMTVYQGGSVLLRCVLH